MERITTIAINHRVVKRYGTRAAAVAGWLFAQCQAQVPREECKKTGLARVYRKSVRVKVSCTQLGKMLHLSRHTVEAILKRFEAEGIINVWLPHGEDRTRAYSIAPEGFALLHRWAGEWYVAGEEILSCWGLDTGVASKVGVNAAIVFQYLWHWSRNYSWGSHYTKDGRTWLPYSAAELSRWIVFMSDDVIEAALHTLEAAGLLEKMRRGRVTKWAIADAGYDAMGQMPPVCYADAGFDAMGEVSPLQMSSAHSCGEARRLYAGSPARNVGRGNSVACNTFYFSKRGVRSKLCCGDALPTPQPSRSEWCTPLTDG